MKLFDRLGKLRDRRRPYCTMIVPAAGESRRMGGGNKLLLPLEGEPVLAHTLRAIDAATLVDEIILSTRTECLAEMAELCRRCGLQKPCVWWWAVRPAPTRCWRRRWRPTKRPGSSLYMTGQGP